MTIIHPKKTKVWLSMFIFLFFGIINEATADIMLSDRLSVGGFLKYQLTVHTAQKNPYNTEQEDNNSINLSRAFFVTDWTYRPANNVKIFSKLRLIHDSTNDIDDDLGNYNAFPLATPRYGTYLRPTKCDDFLVEMSELYADLNLGASWFRIGKQQIVWGEMIGARIMDLINPLDYSWHLMFEPEEYEQIRLPQWSIRGVYNVEQKIVPWLNDFYLEGFMNPGDISPQINPEFGAPFNLKSPTAVVFELDEKDRRGDIEYGFRLGGRIGHLFCTLNYLHLYTDGGYWKYSGMIAPPVPPNPPPYFLEKVSYPSTNILGVTLNYSFAPPLNTTVTFEGTYTHDQPYQKLKTGSMAAFADIKEAGTLNYAIRFDRMTFILPPPVRPMDIKVQFTQKVIKDHDDIMANPAPFDEEYNQLDSTSEFITLLLSQDFMHNDIRLSFKGVYDFDGDYWIMPGFKYNIGDHWRFDIHGMALGGSDRRVGRLGYFYWADEISARIIFQF